MVIAQISKIKSLIPIKPGSPEDLTFGETEERVMFFGDHPTNPEKGKAILSINFFEGQLADIAELTIIGLEPIKAMLLSTEKNVSGGFDLEIYFNRVYEHGFEYGIKDSLLEGGGLIGFTKEEKASVNRFATQKQLFDLLIEYIIDTRKAEIRELPLPCYILTAMENGAPDASHFVGMPQIEKETSHPKNNKNETLFHLASLSTDDFQSLFQSYTSSELRNYLSFYIDIEDTQNGWPEDPDRFRIIHYDHPAIDDAYHSLFLEPPFAIGFEERLDLPGSSHSAVRALNLNAGEMARYETLEQLFKSILGWEDQEVNKLFGYPESVQYCVAYEVEQMKNKRDHSDEIYKDAVHWQLLLQISPYSHWFKFFDRFGDGTIYFMIRKGNLDKGDFSDVQVVVQNT